MLKNFKPVGLVLLAGMLFYAGQQAHAEQTPIKQGTGVSQQSGKVTGTIEDDFGPVTGASVVVKGTTNGTITDLNGNFTLEGVKSGVTIQISFIGYSTQEIKYTGQAELKIKLLEDTQKLDEVVVTALGLKRQQKALGYAVTELKGSDLQTNNINPVASLQGKVAGVEISNSDGGMFGSTKIQIRGASTLGDNNQPIYVVDGIIMDNNVSTMAKESAEYNSNSEDYGNELKNLNPDDFESISVLKGAAATALYGSRGLNGAVVITTKSGKSGSGLGINVSQTFGVDYVYKQPDLQNVYGDGAFSSYVDYGEKDKKGNYYRFDPQHQFFLNSAGQHTLINKKWMGTSFGPRFDGSSIEGYDRELTNYNPVENNYKDAYNLGFNSNTNVSVHGGNDKTTFYTSLSYKYANGTLPNNSFERLAMLAKASHKISNRVSLEASVSFANSMPKNAQPNIGEYFSAQAYSDGSKAFGRTYDTNYYRDKYLGEHGGVAQTSYGDKYGSVPGREFWMSLYNDNYTQKETSVRPTLTLNVDIFEWLKFRAEGNFNYYYKRAEKKNLGQGYANEGGEYMMSLYTKEQTNLNAAFTGNKTFGDWTVGGFLRGEYYNNYIQSMGMNTRGGLIIPGQYFIENSKNVPEYSPKIEGTKRMMSVAFQGSVSWKNQIFVDVTGRNDWSSALVYTNRTGNYSYFYPSVSGSWLINETFELPSWVSLGKIRASWAQVGNDTGAYDINPGYTINSAQYGNDYIYSLSLPNKVYDPNLKPERKNAWEIGLDWRFFSSRLNIDATYYKENTRDQIMDISIPYVSGVSQQKINAGDIQNSGVEIALNTIPFKNKDWEWSLDFTYTKNENKIVSLHENVANYINLLGDAQGGNFRLASVAKVGYSYGMLMTDSKPKIDEKTGKEVLTWVDSRRAAYAQRSGKVEEVGSVVPDFLGSVATGLKWKNLSLRVALDMRFGGYVASYGSKYGTSAGMTETSLGYRDPEHGGVTWTSKFDGITYTDGYIPDGVFAPGTMITTADEQKVDVSNMTYQEAFDKGIVEPTHADMWWMRRDSWGQGVIDDSWFKKLNYIALREVTVNYRMPTTIASKIGAKTLVLGLTGRNLGYLLNTMPNNENPEALRGTLSTEFRARSFSAFTASYMFNINVGF